MLILEVAFQHLLALILSMGARLKNNCFGIHGLVTYALLACGLVIVCVKFWRFHVSNVMLLMLAFDAIAGLVVNAVFVQEM